MSVVITMKFQGDVATFRQALTDYSEEYAKMAAAARTGGGLHHRFAVGDGFVLVVDEWETVERFQKFVAFGSAMEIEEFTPLTSAANETDVLTVVRCRAKSRQTGKSTAMDLHHLFRFRDGKIAYYRGTEDTTRFQRDLDFPDLGPRIAAVTDAQSQAGVASLAQLVERQIPAWQPRIVRM